MEGLLDDCCSLTGELLNFSRSTSRKLFLASVLAIMSFIDSPRFGASKMTEKCQHVFARLLPRLLTLAEALDESTKAYQTQSAQVDHDALQSSLHTLQTVSSASGYILYLLNFTKFQSFLSFKFLFYPLFILFVT